MACRQTVRERQKILAHLPTVLTPAEHTPANLQLLLDVALAGRIAPSDQAAMAERMRATGMLQRRT